MRRTTPAPDTSPTRQLHLVDEILVRGMLLVMLGKYGNPSLPETILGIQKLICFAMDDEEPTCKRYVKTLNAEPLMRISLITVDKLLSAITNKRKQKKALLKQQHLEAEGKGKGKGKGKVPHTLIETSKDIRERKLIAGLTLIIPDNSSISFPYCNNSTTINKIISFLNERDILVITKKCSLQLTPTGLKLLNNDAVIRQLRNLMQEESAQTLDYNIRQAKSCLSYLHMLHVTISKSHSIKIDGRELSALISMIRRSLSGLLTRLEQDTYFPLLTELELRANNINKKDQLTRLTAIITSIGCFLERIYATEYCIIPPSSAQHKTGSRFFTTPTAKTPTTATSASPGCST